MSGYRHQNLKYEIRLCKGLNSSLIFQSSLKSFMKTNCKTIFKDYNCTESGSKIWRGIRVITVRYCFYKHRFMPIVRLSHDTMQNLCLVKIIPMVLPLIFTYMVMFRMRLWAKMTRNHITSNVHKKTINSIDLKVRSQGYR